MLNYYRSSNPSVQAPVVGGVPPLLRSLFPVQIGLDASNIFAFSFLHRGIAVVRPDGRIVAFDEGRLQDVTLTAMPYCSGTGLGVVRIPVHEVECGDVIIASDCPLAVYFCLEDTADIEGGFQVIDAFTGNSFRYMPPINPFFSYLVRVRSMFDNLFHVFDTGDHEHGDIDQEQNDDVTSDSDDSPLRRLLPLLFLGGQLQCNSSPLITLALMQVVLGRIV